MKDRGTVCKQKENARMTHSPGEQMKFRDPMAAYERTSETRSMTRTLHERPSDLV